MGEILSSFVADLLARAEGPLHLRLLFQPLMAIAFAIRDGRKDALAGRPAYGWAVVTDGAAVMRSTAAALGFPWLHCFPHRLNLVVRDNLKMPQLR